MAYSPMDFFEVGQKVGKSKRTTFGRTSDTLLDQFNKGIESDRTLNKAYQLEKMKSGILSPKEQAETELTTQKSNYFKKLTEGQGVAGIDPGIDDDFVVDRIGPGGPTFVNQKARLQQKMASAQVGELPKLDRAFDAVQQLKSLYETSFSPVSVPRGTSPLTGGLNKLKQGLSGKAGAITGSNPQLNRYLANREGFASLISKGGFMEAGVLTQEDIQRIVNVLPSEFSTKEESDIAWTEIDNVLSSARRRFEGGPVNRADRAQDASTTNSSGITREQAQAELERRRRLRGTR